MARPPKAKAAPLAAPAPPDPEERAAPPVPDGEAAAALVADHLDLWEANAGRVDETILALACGIKTALTVQKKKLSRGDVAEQEVTTADGEVLWVYTQRPDPGMLRLVREQLKGKAGQREAAATATTLVLKFCVPGREAELDAYLASLPAETLARYALPAETLARLAAARRAA